MFGLFKLGVFLFFVMFVVGAAAQSLPVDHPSGRQCCESKLQCHFITAMMLLNRASCTGLETKYVGVTDSVSRMKLAVEELEAASRLLPEPKLVGEHVVDFHLAGALLLLTRAYVARKEFALSQNTAEKAAAVYRSLATKAYDHKREPDYLERIAAGLIRCGKPLYAIPLLLQLPPGGTERLYLLAEVFFSIGDRERAALAYEQWIGAGCDLQLRMITDDEYGYRAWDLLMPKATMSLGPCGHLPNELRARLEDLREQYHHPNNLPTKNEPAASLRLFRTL